MMMECHFNLRIWGFGSLRFHRLFLLHTQISTFLSTTTIFSLGCTTTKKHHQKCRSMLQYKTWNNKDRTRDGMMMMVASLSHRLPLLLVILLLFLLTKGPNLSGNWHVVFVWFFSFWSSWFLGGFVLVFYANAFF